MSTNDDRASVTDAAAWRERRQRAGVQEALRAWAKGLYPAEAGVELLIRQGKAIYEPAPWLEELERPEGPSMVSIDVSRLLEEVGAWSGGEQRVVRIAASLLGGPPVDLAEEISGLDRPALALVLAALAHANGSHQHSDMTFDVDGRPRIERLPALVAWPEEVR